MMLPCLLISCKQRDARQQFFFMHAGYNISVDDIFIYYYFFFFSYFPRIHDLTFPANYLFRRQFAGKSNPNFLENKKCHKYILAAEFPKECQPTLSLVGVA